jgi:hypothetical protein
MISPQEKLWCSSLITLGWPTSTATTASREKQRFWQNSRGEPNIVQLVEGISTFHCAVSLPTGQILSIPFRFVSLEAARFSLFEYMHQPIGVRLRVEQNQLVVVCWRFGSMVIELQGA